MGLGGTNVAADDDADDSDFDCEGKTRSAMMMMRTSKKATMTANDCWYWTPGQVGGPETRASA